MLCHARPGSPAPRFKDSPSLSSQDPQDPESRIQTPESKSKIHNPESRLQNPNSRLQTPGSRIQNPESRIQNPKSRIQNPKSRILKSRIQHPEYANQTTVVTQMVAQWSHSGHTHQICHPGSRSHAFGHIVATQWSHSGHTMADHATRDHFYVT